MCEMNLEVEFLSAQFPFELWYDLLVRKTKQFEHTSFLEESKIFIQEKAYAVMVRPCVFVFDPNIPNARLTNFKIQLNKLIFSKENFDYFGASAAVFN